MDWIQRLAELKPKVDEIIARHEGVALSELRPMDDDEAGWGPGCTEPPAECFDDSGAFRGDVGWENRWDTYRLDHSDGWAR